jgi:hypothetical protein
VGGGVWGGSPCTAVTPTCTVKEAGSNGVGLSMDTRLLGPRGVNGLKITKQHHTTSSDHLAHQAPASCRLRSDTQLAAHPHHDSPPSDQPAHSKVSLRRAV